MALSCKAGIKVLLEDISIKKNEIETCTGLGCTVSGYEDLINKIKDRLENIKTSKPPKFSDYSLISKRSRARGLERERR